MKATRIEVRSPAGQIYYKSLPEVEILIEKKRLEWSEKGVSARAVVPQNFVDYSGVLTDRCNWTVTTSGYCGPEVMELL